MSVISHITLGTNNPHRAGLTFSVNSSAVPMIADSTEPANTAMLAAAKSASAGKAWPAMNSDIVERAAASES